MRDSATILSELFQVHEVAIPKTRIFRNEIQPADGRGRVELHSILPKIFTEEISSDQTLIRRSEIVKETINSPLRLGSSIFFFLSRGETSIGRRLFKADRRFDPLEENSAAGGEVLVKRAAPRPKADKSHRIRD